MAAHNGSSPRHGGSHFSTGARPSGRTASSHAPAPRPGATGTVGTGRVSRRTADATRRASARRGATHRARAASPQRRGRVPLAAIAVAGTLVIAALVAFVLVPALLPSGDAGDRPAVADGTEVTFTVPDGSGAGAVAQILYDNGLIDDQSAFLSEIRRTESESLIKSGSYRVVAGTDDTDIIELLTTGPNASTATLTVPEGYTVSQVAQAVQDSLGISADDFLAQAKASNYAADYAFLSAAADDSLEGFLFPKTYDFSGAQSVDADTVIRAMLDQYQAEVGPLDLDAAAAALSSRYGIEVDGYDVLTMASIVEREAVTDEQRPQVASVFYNRLAAGMRLQSDATLTYSLGRAATADEINTLDDPYNTNLRDGLTPTPICSPSLASVQAAMEPADTSYYYFYITSDTAQFSETYDEHMRAYS